MILILLMAVIVAFSTFTGTLLIEDWPRCVKVFCILLGSLPLIVWITNFMQAPVPVELELSCFFAGILTGIALLFYSIKAGNANTTVCICAGLLSAGASITAGIGAISIYLLP